MEHAAVEAAAAASVAPLEEGAVVVDVEPVADTVVEEVVEENPSATADEGETVVE
jgi:hypothetical protein